MIPSAVQGRDESIYHQGYITCKRNYLPCKLVDDCWQYNATSGPYALQTHWPYKSDERLAARHFQPLPVKLDKKED